MGREIKPEKGAKKKTNGEGVVVIEREWGTAILPPNHPLVWKWGRQKKGGRVNGKDEKGGCGLIF